MTQFILVGLIDQSVLQLPLFFIFLVMYVVTVMGNSSLIILIGLSSHLHTPMYLFLFNLSFRDLCYSSVFTPRMLINIISKKKIISYMGCMIQLYFFTFFGISECYVLTSMAYDCYVAICSPLLYNAAMSPKVCSSLMLGSSVMAFSGAMAHTGCMLRLTFYDVNSIIYVTPALCSSSPAQVPTSLSWKLSSCQESTSLCTVSPSCRWPHPLQHPSHQLHRGQV